MHALRMNPMLRWAIALIVTSIVLDHAVGEGRMGPCSFARAPGRLSWAQGELRDGSVREMGMSLTWPEESSRDSLIRPLSSPAFDCIAAHFCLAMRLRGGAAARRGKRGGGNAKPGGKRKAAPVVDNAFQEDVGDRGEDFQEDGDALQGEIGAIAANLERELGDVDAAVKAAGAGASSAGRGGRSKATSLDDNPSVKSAIAGLDSRMRASGKTEEELAEEQQRLFEEMRAQMSSNMAREMVANEEGEMTEDRGGRKKKRLFEGFDEGTGSKDKADLKNDSGVDEDLDGFDDEYDALMGMVGGDEGIRDLDADGAAVDAAAIEKGKASRSGKSKDAEPFDVVDDGQDLIEEEEEEEEGDVYDQESVERGKGRDANGEEEEDLEYGGEGREDEDVDEAEARLMDIDDGPVAMPSQWTGVEGAENFAKELGDVAKLTGEFTGLDEFSSSSGGTAGGRKKRQREGEEEEDDPGDGDVARKGGTALENTSFLEGGWNKSFFEEGLLENASSVGEGYPGDSNATLEDTDEEPEPGWDGFWKDADYEYSPYKWVAGTEGKEQPGRLPNMTDAEYFAELEAEGNRFLRHMGIPPEIHPSNRNGSMPSKSTMREIFASEMSEDSDDGRRRSSSVSSSDFVFDVPNNETEVERIQRTNKEISATGVTRDFRRAWEGESSDTWEDSDDNRNLTEGAPRIKRRRIPGSPTERMNQHFESHSMLGMVPHSRPGKGVGEGMAPPIRNLSDMIDQAGFAGKEYVYTSWGRLRDVPPMRDCMADRLDGGNRTGGYGTVVSELNWSPEDRVRLNITADDQPEHHKGMSGVHFRKIVSAKEFLENTPVNYHTVKPDPSIPSADFFEFSD